MKKTLIVSYLPRGERSNTRKLLDAFVENAKNTTIDTLDLVENMPDMFDNTNLIAYIERNYMGKELDEKQADSLEKMDTMTAQLKSADFVVIAYPMFNFSMPAAVKAWFDSVMLKSETWDMNESGFVGLMKGKKALVLTTSGGVYEGDTALFNHSENLAKAEFAFMGFETDVVKAEGMNSLTEDGKQSALEEAEKKVAAVAKKWYNHG